MHIYGLNDSRRVFATLAPMLKTMIAYIFFTLLLHFFFAFMGEGSPENALAAHMAISTVTGFVIQAYFMGRLTEIIFSLNPLPCGDLLRKHLPRFLATIVLLALFTAPFFSLFSALAFKDSPHVTFFIINVAIKIISIYVFPLLFITSQIRFALATGAKCLLGNLKDSFFLIFLSVAGFIFEGYALPTLLPSFGKSPVFIAFATACNIFFALYIFTSASWIMREKLYGGTHRTLH